MITLKGSMTVLRSIKAFFIGVDNTPSSAELLERAKSRERIEEENRENFKKRIKSEKSGPRVYYSSCRCCGAAVGSNSKCPWCGQPM